MLSPAAALLALPVEEGLLASVVGVGAVAPLTPYGVRTVDLLRADEERERQTEQEQKRFMFWALTGFVLFWFWKRRKKGGGT